VGLVFSGAVVAAGIARLDGRPISATQALRVAAGRWRQLAAWAATTTLVSLFDMVTRRFGVAGAVARLITEVAWALATMLVLPVILVEGKMPVAAIRESAHLVKRQLGFTVRTKIRLYVPWLVASVISALLTVGGIVGFLRYQHETSSWAAASLIVAAAGVLLFFGTVSVQNAADAYLNTLLYRHALGQPIPDVDGRELPRLPGTSGPMLPAWPPGPTHYSGSRGFLCLSRRSRVCPGSDTGDHATGLRPRRRPRAGRRFGRAGSRWRGHDGPLRRARPRATLPRGAAPHLRDGSREAPTGPRPVRDRRRAGGTPDHRRRPRVR
jgi:hypothetical protein